MTAMGDLENYLELVMKAQNRWGVETPKDWKYNGVGDIILKHGHRFGSKHASPVKKMMPRACFNNAYKLAMSGAGLHYCEGYALNIIPIHHAWCCDDEGTIYDPTWHNAEEAVYLGCVFNIVTVAEFALKVGRPGVFFHDARIDQKLVHGHFELVELDVAHQTV